MSLGKSQSLHVIRLVEASVERAKGELKLLQHDVDMMGEVKGYHLGVKVEEIIDSLNDLLDNAKKVKGNL